MGFYNETINRFRGPMISQTEFNLSDNTYPNTPAEYNGWSDWTPWNCALWIGNSMGYYNLAITCRDYIQFINEVGPSTPDGALWVQANYDEMQQ